MALTDLVTAEAFGFLLILTRIAAMLALMPAIGETNIPAPARIGLAVMISLLLFPMVREMLPAPPANVFAFAQLIIVEILIGVFVGLTARLMISALHVAGTVIAFQSGLAAAQSFDPSQGAQSALVARFLTVLGIVAIFAADLHLTAVRAMVGTYGIFTPGEMFEIKDAAEVVLRTVAHAFALGLQISAPFLVYGLVFNIALGLIARLMPQLQVFFIAMPANIGLAMVVLFLVISAMMMWFLNRYEEQLSMFLGT